MTRPELASHWRAGTALADPLARIVFVLLLSLHVIFGQRFSANDRDEMLRLSDTVDDLKDRQSMLSNRIDTLDKMQVTQERLQGEDHKAVRKLEEDAAEMRGGVTVIKQIGALLGLLILAFGGLFVNRYFAHQSAMQQLLKAVFETHGLVNSTASQLAEEKRSMQKRLDDMTAMLATEQAKRQGRMPGGGC